jgi:surface carbohydrate biosynthesis protein (TIGR04326 family)
MDEVGIEARELYVDIVADIGLFSMPDGRTLRAKLGEGRRTSSWWYHPVAYRNSEGDPTYKNILAILAIKRQAQARNVRTLYLENPPAGVADVLSSAFQVHVPAGQHDSAAWFDVLRGLLGRVPFLIRMLKAKLALMFSYTPSPFKMDVAFQGFWDWSVSPSEAVPGQLADRYFGKLPDELRARGKRVGYWCWYDPWNRPGVKRPQHRKTLKPLEDRSDVLLLPSLLKIREIVVAMLDLGALPVMLSAMRSKAFRAIFQRGGLDFYSLFKLPLIRGCISSGIPQCRLFELAAYRAQKLTRPDVEIQFQEHNPSSRAIYAALSGSGTLRWAMQHASYNRSKTYLAFHAEKEFQEQKDGQTVPHPERVCVMGGLGRSLFGSCGYASDQLLPTGSARYDHVNLGDKGGDSRAGMSDSNSGRTRILIATSLPASVDFLMVEAAAEAVRGLEERVILRLRQHPFDRMEEQPGFASLAPMLHLSHSSLDEDLVWADLILISQSTVGEEAFLAGKPVWQLRSAYPDQSALAEVADIPRFYTVSELHEALVELVMNRKMRSAKTTAADVYRGLFQTGHQKPSVAIAEKICETI